MHQVLKCYRVQACIRTASFKVRTSPHFEDRSYVGNRVFFPAVFFWLRTVWMTTGRSVGGAGDGSRMGVWRWWYLLLGVVGHVGLSGGSWVAVVVRGRGRRN